MLPQPWNLEAIFPLGGARRLAFARRTFQSVFRQSYRNGDMIDSTISSVLPSSPDQPSPSPVRGNNGAASAVLDLNKDTAWNTAKIMVVDDEPLNIQLAVKYLELAGFWNFVTTMDSREAIAMVNDQRPDVLLLDIMMPHVSGLEILEKLRGDDRWMSLAIVILTADNDQATKRKALQLGASDFLRKPVDPIELIPRVRNVALVKKHSDFLQQYASQMEDEVLIRTAELAKSRREITQCLARAAEFRDDDSGQHVLRVGRYARLIAKELSWDDISLDLLEQAAQLHDIGKIAIPDSILLKPGKLTAEEFEIVSRHPLIGQQILKRPDDEQQLLREHTMRGARLLENLDSPILHLAGNISLTHHERWDGNGYPQHLAGEAIPIEGRIVAVADVFDALSSERPYKHAYPVEECFRIIEEGRGTQFDPNVLDAFIRCRQDILFTYVQHADVA